MIVHMRILDWVVERMIEFCLCVCTEGVFYIETLVVAVGLMTLLVLLYGVLCSNDNIRVLRGEKECLKAKIEDIEAERAIMYLRGEKRHNEDKLFSWITNSRKLLDEVEDLLMKIGARRGALVCPKIMDVVHQHITKVRGHEREGYKLSMMVYPPKQGPQRGIHIPVRELIGGKALCMLGNLQDLLQNNEDGRIAIYGVKGIGKTTLMKHLHNWVLKWVGGFDRVIWVTSPAHFTINNVQDAVAAAINCDLPFGDDLDVRAEKLSHTLKSLGRCVLFLDDVPQADFSLEEVGIPGSIKSSGLKLVLSTASTRSFRMFNGFVTVEVDCVPPEEAYELFLHEAGITIKSLPAFGDTPRLLAEECRRVPGRIVDAAAGMFGIHDLHEWRNALFETRFLGVENNLHSWVLV